MAVGTVRVVEVEVEIEAGTVIAVCLHPACPWNWFESTEAPIKYVAACDDCVAQQTGVKMLVRQTSRPLTVKISMAVPAVGAMN